jgi:hypothetical protein
LVYNARMRVCIVLVLVASVACKKKPDSDAAGSAAGSATGDAAAAVVDDAATGAPIDAGGDAASTAVDAAVALVDAGPPPAAFCFDSDTDEDAQYSQVAADDKAITFCLRLESSAKCARLDLAAGSFTPVAAPPVPPDKPITPPDTSKLELPAGHEYMTATSPDGKTIAATTDLEGQLFIVDAATGKLRKLVKWTADGGCMESPSFIGDNIYVQYNVCAGPGATGWIVSPAGKKLGSLKHVNPTGTFFSIGNGAYAFEDFGGSSIEIVDGKKGKSVEHISIETPADCDDCAAFRTGALGLVQLPGGKLVQLAGRITVVDPIAVSIVKTIKWPLCAKAK